ncbi:hypothetical protein LICSK_13915 [Leptospira interrogans serovar Copenhageni]|nr:Uncharacterized protein A9P81_1400 [Leptospira interrogans serovar Copenhageni/Icterohaemorrhagiae]OCC27513.1 Uncharacterized protein GNX_4014 [Leptospira interrogans serovar Canicola]QIP65050.1 hypothetical protein LICSK_13915 [Leptospira interrogans serovar Copenhageni]SIQ81820.1 hypothetical protein SAMN05421689_12726 [Leptospira interrogans]
MLQSVCLNFTTIYKYKTQQIPPADLLSFFAKIFLQRIHIRYDYNTSYYNSKDLQIKIEYPSIDPFRLIVFGRIS